MSDCLHYVVRKAKARYAENVYVCGNCSKLFTVKEYTEPKIEPEPLGKNPIPWGLRNRQA